MTPELGAALVGFILALTTFVKQVTDKNRLSKQSDENNVKLNEEIAVLKTKVKIIESNSDKQDSRFLSVESELKAINGTLNQLIGMIKGRIYEEKDNSKL
jgi:hypothetical protein